MYFERGIIFISIYCVISCSESVVKQCHEQPIKRQWEPSNTRPANVMTLKASNESKIFVQVTNRREDLNLTVLAQPVDNQSERCPEDPNYNVTNLRRFWRSYSITKNKTYENEIFNITNAFTGCYYFVLTNKENKNWKQFSHFQSDYKLIDTSLECYFHDLIPEDEITSSELQIDLEFSLNCLSFEIWLHESEARTNNDSCEFSTIMPVQKCRINLNDYNETLLKPTSECDVSTKFTNLTLGQIKPVTKKNDKWKMRVVWEQLQRGGALYCSSFKQSAIKCNLNYDDAYTWIPDTEIGVINYGSRSASNPKSQDVNYPNLTFISFAILPVMLLVLLYWIQKFIVILNKKRYEENRNENVEVQEIMPFHEENESDQILLMYTRDSPLFVKAIDGFKKELQQKCKCNVHDIYSMKDWTEVVRLGPNEWVEQKMKSGCKIIWVDTPQFRSRLNGKSCISADSRDKVMPFAVALAKTSFQNFTTQYRRHFVIRFTKLDVSDEFNDPLSIISPHARYRIPENLNELCLNLMSKQINEQQVKAEKLQGDDNILLRVS